MTASETILEEAQRLIHGERNKNYGHPRDNFRDISALFSAYLGIPINDLDVANLMILVKVARQKGSEYKRDNYTDIAGYAGCAGRIYEEPVDSDNDGAPLGNPRSGDPENDPGPRQWDRIENVPTDVTVQSNLGHNILRWQKQANSVTRLMRMHASGWLHYIGSEEEFARIAPFTEVIEQKPEPRVWERFEDIPDGVEVEDREGDTFIIENHSVTRTGGRGDRLPSEEQYLTSAYQDGYEKTYAPYTEVVSV
ncbi:DUF6378 domain-containing protein [Nocardia grenadensis]|uniref:DUF6378 domain-containing protein n=1 Tax=Nocardia grenadensis TaxID=931537 RepID=UPI003D74C4EE